MQLRALETEHFRPGQKLTPELLKGLQDFTLDRDALLSQLFVGTVGIFDDFLESLRISIDETNVADPLTIRIGTGAAINRDGRILCLDTPHWMSIRGMTIQEDATYILQLLPKEILQHLETDANIPECVAPQTRRLGCTVELGATLRADGVEIARIRFGNSTERLSIATLTEDSCDRLVTHKDTVDVRFARRIRTAGRDLAEVADIVQLRAALREFKSALTKVDVALGPTHHGSVLQNVILMIQAELADTVCHPQRLKFLFLEMRGAALTFFEELREGKRHPSMTDASTKSKWDIFLESVHETEFRSDLKLADSIAPFAHRLALLTTWIREHLLHAAIEKERWVLIRDQLSELRHTAFAFHSKHAFGGELFTLAKHFDAEALKREARAEVAFDTQKTFSASYGDGTPFRGVGRFYSEGTLTLPLEGSAWTHASDIVVMLQFYKRRGHSDFSLSWNGQSVLNDTMLPTDSVDQIVHSGCFISGKQVRDGANELRLQLRRVDLDFGIVGIWIYRT